jgi:viroplasmin and RNaseH domain-containing protein
MFFEGVMTTCYVVYRGRKHSVYTSWANYCVEVTRVENKLCRGFKSLEEAEASLKKFQSCEDTTLFEKEMWAPSPNARIHQAQPKYSTLVSVVILQSFVIIVLVTYIVM